MYKKKSNMLMGGKLNSEKLLDRSLEECFADLSEDIDMTAFVKNLKHLKDNIGQNGELPQVVRQKHTPKPVAKEKEKQDKRVSQHTPKQKPTRPPMDDIKEAKSRRKVELPMHQVVIKNKSAEKLTEKMGKIGDLLKNKLKDEKERSRTREKMDGDKFANFYSRIESHQLKSQVKINILKTKKALEQKEATPFRPKINTSVPNTSNNRSFIDQSGISMITKEEKLRLLQQEKQEKEEEQLRKECTFKPRIRKLPNEPQRSLNDLYKWKERMDTKMIQNKHERDKEMKKVYTFSPNINRIASERRDEEYENPGDRLYSRHQIKMGEKSYNGGHNDRFIDHSQNKRVAYQHSQKYRQSSRNVSRRSSNTSANNSRISDIERKKAENTNNVCRASNRDITPKIKAKFSSNVNQRPSSRLFDANENKPRLDNSGISKDNLNIKKLSIKRTPSPNFIEKNVRKIRDEEASMRELKIAKEKESNKTQKRKYYNSKKDMKVKLGNLENMVRDMSDIEDYFDVR